MRKAGAISQPLCTPWLWAGAVAPWTLLLRGNKPGGGSMAGAVVLSSQPPGELEETQSAWSTVQEHGLPAGEQVWEGRGVLCC